MNEKNEGKRSRLTVNCTAHRRLKKLSKKSGIKLETLTDQAIWQLVKHPPVIVLRAQDGEEE